MGKRCVVGLGGSGAMGVAWAVSLLALVALWGCGEPVPRTPQKPDIVFLLIDTLRPDHVGAYGYEHDTTPFLDALAAQGTVFERAVAQASWTAASMASLWTSRYPSEVGGVVRPGPDGVTNLGQTPLVSIRQDAPTLAERLRGVGYDTRAFVANAYAGTSLGHLRGFDVTVDEPRDAGQLVGAALESLATVPGGPPLFLYLHFRDVHHPTWPPERYRPAFSAGGEMPPQDAASWQYLDAEDPKDPDVQAFRRHKVALYDGALHYVDQEIGRLAQGLVQLRRDRPFVFVLASDHGEAFWEHSAIDRRLSRDPRGFTGVGHGHSLFAEITDVPLIVSGAGVPRGRDDRLVRNVDVAPTLLALAGAEPDADARGIDLFRAVSEAPPTPPIAFSENLAYGIPAWSLEEEDAKLIRYVGPEGDRVELLFDRREDPQEVRDLLEEQPETAARLGARLDALTTGIGAGAAGAAVDLDEETRAELRALGYGS